VTRRPVIYAGSFDPVTNGHIDIIRRARAVFGAVRVLVIPNANKHPLFTLEERHHLLKEALSAEPHVEVDVAPQGLLTDYLKKHGITVLVRGIRSSADLEHEMTNAYFNRLFSPETETVFLAGKPEFSFISSSSVREAARYGADVSALVPACVAKALIQKQHK
jgi:pantetheine-phosphate adenylyltransferase